MANSTTADIAQLGWRDFFRAVWTLLVGLRRKFLIWNTVLILVNFYNLLPSLILALIIDFFTEYQPGQDLRDFYIYIGILTGSSIVAALFRLTAKRKLGELRADLGYNIRSPSISASWF